MSKNNKTKDLIYKTAIKILRENGTLTLKAISEDANVNIAAINYYYGDKDNLIKKIISNELIKLKENLSDYLDKYDHPNTNNEDNMFETISYLYDFCIENMGILGYILDKNNKMSESAVFIYLHEIWLDAKFMDKIMSALNNVTGKPASDYRVKYTQLLSTFTMPLLIELNLINIDLSFMNSIKDRNFRDKYVRQLCKTFFEV